MTDFDRAVAALPPGFLGFPARETFGHNGESDG
jgi:hypothetical protein